MQKEKWMLLGAMGIFGTIGLIVRYIPLSSAVIACARGFMGLVFLLGVMLLTKKKPDLPAIRKNLLLLAVSGAAMGFNWILLFESYRYTTVATATVCYYLAPLMLLLACPLLGERLTGKKLLCVGIALVGLVFVSGVLQQMPTKEELLGIAFGLGAAVLYASVMFMNKKLSPIPAYDKTILQLGSAAIVILPYILLTEGLPSFSLTAIQWVLLIVVGIVHTGIAYALYFGSMKNLRAQTIAVFSYLDPVIAVLLSALVLRETMTWGNILGAILILGSALYSELPTKEKAKSVSDDTLFLFSHRNLGDRTQCIKSFGSVGDKHSLLSQRLQSPQHRILRPGIQRRGAFIQQENGTVHQHGSGNGQSLQLTLGKACVIFLHMGLFLLGHIPNEIRLGGRQRRAQHIHRYIRPHHLHIFQDRAGKQGVILGHISKEMPCLLGAGNVALGSFQVYITHLGLIQSQNQLKHSGLALAGHAGKAAPARKGDAEGKVLEDRRFLAGIGKGHTVEDDGFHRGADLLALGGLYGSQKL